MKKSIVIAGAGDARLLASAALKCKSPVFLLYEENIINAKSIMGVFSIGTGKRVVVSAEGEDSAAFFDEILPLTAEKGELCNY